MIENHTLEERMQKIVGTYVALDLFSKS